MSDLNYQHRRELIVLARNAISERILRGTTPTFSVTTPLLLKPRAAFVSLYGVDDKERGSSGTLYEETPLWETVALHAGRAAADDGRFPAVTTRELKRVVIEISVLTPFVPIKPDDVVIGQHGLYVAKGPKRAVLLPQVATQMGWSRVRFLDEICQHAGLAPRAFEAPDVFLMGFEAQIFSDLTVADENLDAG